MPVLRQHHTQNFTTIPNALLQDQRLSCRDRGLLVWMLSRPTNWKFTKSGILAEMENDGERSIQSAVTKLQKFGYLRITRGSRKNGRITETVWTVYDTPQLQNAVVEHSESGEHEYSSPQLRSPSVQNAAIIKDRIKKEKESVPAIEGGAQIPAGFYYDTDSNEYRRKDKA